ncbi:MAG: putative lipid II flippase FtsW [Candidatus Magasanikbacteria bacterium]|nr:putative lipid II flippase FtsW [Candidatus Magasanikbacteria bacterium]
MRLVVPKRLLDRQLIIYLSILVLAGLVVLISASAPQGYAKFNDGYFFLKRQIAYGLLPGLVFFLYLSRRDYQWTAKRAYLIYFLSLILLASVFIPGLGTVLNGSRSWISLGGFTVQPSEFAKLGIIIMAAYLLSRRQINWGNWSQSLLPMLAVLAPALGLVLAEPDVGTLSILVFIICALFFVAGIPYRLLLLLGSLSLAGLVILILVAPYRLERITTFLHPELDPQGVGYHINQAFLAIGSGGFWGLGYGASRQKFQYLPETSADSIFAVVAEENGFLIASALVILFFLIGWRGLRIAREASDSFGKYLVFGVTVWFLWQATLNIGAMVGILPLTGVPLPLVSHGGSAYIAMLIGWALVVSVSRGSKKLATS